MSMIVLDQELTEKFIIKKLGHFIDGSVQGFSFSPPKSFKPLGLLNRQHGTQIIFMELRGDIESWKKISSLLFYDIIVMNAEVFAKGFKKC